MGVVAQCENVDHAACWASIEEACPKTVYPRPEGCAEAIVACYDAGPEVIGTGNLHELCRSEPGPDCDSDNPAACGLSFCQCMAGADPYDWENCHHLTLSACAEWLQDADCEGALAQCYPGATEEAYRACADALPEPCRCPMCGMAEMCEAELAACLGA